MILRQQDEFSVQLGELHRLAHYQMVLGWGPLVAQYPLPHGQETFPPPLVMDQSPLTLPVNPPLSCMHPIMQRYMGEQQPLPSCLPAQQYTPPALPIKFVACKRQAVTAEDPILQYQQLMHATAKHVTERKRKQVVAAVSVRSKLVVAKRTVQRKPVVAKTAVRSKRLRDEPETADGNPVLGDMRPPASRQRLGKSNLGMQTQLDSRVSKGGAQVLAPAQNSGLQSQGHVVPKAIGGWDIELEDDRIFLDEMQPPLQYEQLPFVQSDLGLKAWEMGADKWSQDYHQGGKFSSNPTPCTASWELGDLQASLHPATGPSLQHLATHSSAAVLAAEKASAEDDAEFLFDSTQGTFPWDFSSQDWGVNESAPGASYSRDAQLPANGWLQGFAESGGELSDFMLADFLFPEITGPDSFDCFMADEINFLAPQ